MEACSSCEKYYNDKLATAESMITDAVFKCPAGECASKLSFQEYFAEECCEASERKRLLVLSLNILFILKIYKK